MPKKYLEAVRKADQTVNPLFRFLGMEVETMAHAVLGGNQPGQRATTVDMSVSYLRPVQSGDDLICQAHVINFAALPENQINQHFPKISRSLLSEVS